MVWFTKSRNRVLNHFQRTKSAEIAGMHVSCQRNRSHWAAKRECQNPAHGTFQPTSKDFWPNSPICWWLHPSGLSTCALCSCPKHAKVWFLLGETSAKFPSFPGQSSAKNHKILARLANSFDFRKIIQGQKPQILMVWSCLTQPRCSMVLEYLPTSLGDFWGFCVGKSSSTMDPSWASCCLAVLSPFPQHPMSIHEPLADRIPRLPDSPHVAWHGYMCSNCMRPWGKKGTQTHTHTHIYIYIFVLLLLLLLLVLLVLLLLSLLLLL